MFVDLWGWFDRFRAEARRAGDAERLRLTDIHHQAWEKFETEPHSALLDLQNGSALAAGLHEKCWVLFFDYWQCEVYLFFLTQYNAALELAVRTAVEARKPEYEDCPIRARVYRVLVDSYLHFDPVGYAPQIRENLNYLEASVPLDIDTWRLIEARRATLAIEFEDWAEAEADSLHYMARSETNEFRMIHAHSLLCKIAYERNQYEEALRQAQAGETFARRQRRQHAIASFLAWQALLCRKLGDEESASRFYRNAVARKSRLYLAHSAIYEVLSDYHETAGEYKAAMQMLDKRLKEATASGSLYEECDCRVDRCKLLAAMGAPLDDEMALARAAAAKLIDPAFILTKLDSIQNDSGSRA
jgi:hypothetical protein